MVNSFIYGLVDPETLELRYVGKTRVGMKRALAQHSARCRNWIRKLKRRGLVQEVIVLEETNDLNEAERRLISLFRRLGHPLTNVADGGEGNSKGTPSAFKGRKHTEQSKLKIAKAVNLRKQSLEKQGLPWISDESKALISSKLKGITRSEETRKRISEARRGITFSEETRRRLSESLKGNQNRKKKS